MKSVTLLVFIIVASFAACQDLKFSKESEDVDLFSYVDDAEIREERLIKRETHMEMSYDESEEGSGDAAEETDEWLEINAAEEVDEPTEGSGDVTDVDEPEYSLRKMGAPFRLAHSRRLRCPKSYKFEIVQFLSREETQQPLMSIVEDATNKIPSHELTIRKLSQYLQNNPKEIILNLNNEFKNVPNISQQLYGELFESKNRYKNILPFEKSTVKLSLLPNKPDSHYINASYIKGYKQDKKYIATQGPLKETLRDFWRMIWEENITLIIMLTNLKEDFTQHCEQYWPNRFSTFYNYYKVTLEKEEKFVEYTKREFVLAVEKAERKVTQMHFTIWNEKGIPQTPYGLVKFLKETRKHTIGPILVHCNDGINRTGAFLLCDYIIDMAESGAVNFPQALKALRLFRQNMVKKEQYLYCYCVVNEFLNGNLNVISENELKENNVSQEIIAETLKKIQNSNYWLNILHPATVRNENNVNRINIQDPTTSNGVIRIQQNPNDETNYIDAVEILGKARNAIINAPQPSRDTLAAFWGMVLDKKISLILSLQELDFNDKTSIKFWPTTNEALNPIDCIEITLIQNTTYDAYNKIHVKLEDTRKKDEPDVSYVHIFHFKKWKRNSLPKIDEFLFYHKMYSEHKHKERTIVACRNAVDASSVFLTFLHLIETLRQNSTVDVNTAVSTLKIYRRNFNLDMAKLKFIYDALHDFLQDKELRKDTSEVYENLKKAE